MFVEFPVQFIVKSDGEMLTVNKSSCMIWHSLLKLLINVDVEKVDSNTMIRASILGSKVFRSAG